MTKLNGIGFLILAVCTGTMFVFPAQIIGFFVGIFFLISFSLAFSTKPKQEEIFNKDEQKKIAQMNEYERYDELARKIGYPTYEEWKKITTVEMTFDELQEAFGID